MLRSHQAKANVNSNISLIFDVAQCEQLHRKQYNSFVGSVAFSWYERTLKIHGYFQNRTAVNTNPLPELYVQIKNIFLDI